MMEIRERLIVALDVASMGEGLTLAEKLAGSVGYFKVGMELYYSTGPAIVEELQRRGGKIFLDLKLHDIPNTVGKAAAVIARLGVAMFNVHAAGGREMMRAALEMSREAAAKTGVTPPRVIAVTVLTSINQQVLAEEVGIDRTVEEQVVRWALLAKEAGLDGVVASPLEVAAIRRECGPDFLIVTPGVRPTWAAAGDQKRFTTPAEALRAGASCLVIGRPITAAPDPAAAAEKILAEMEAGLC